MTDPLASDLLMAITLAMTHPDPRIGMWLLELGVGVVLREQRGGKRAPEPTPLRPLGWDEPPTEPFPDLLPDERSAEYHYAIAERERSLREG